MIDPIIRIIDVIDTILHSIDVIDPIIRIIDVKDKQNSEDVIDTSMETVLA